MILLTLKIIKDLWNGIIASQEKLAIKFKVNSNLIERLIGNNFNFSIFAKLFPKIDK